MRTQSYVDIIFFMVFLHYFRIQYILGLYNVIFFFFLQSENRLNDYRDVHFPLSPIFIFSSMYDSIPVSFITCFKNGVLVFPSGVCLLFFSLLLRLCYPSAIPYLSVWPMLFFAISACSILISVVIMQCCR